MATTIRETISTKITIDTAATAQALDAADNADTAASVANGVSSNALVDANRAEAYREEAFRFAQQESGLVLFADGTNSGLKSAYAYAVEAGGHVAQTSANNAAAQAAAGTATVAAGQAASSATESAAQSVSSNAARENAVLAAEMAGVTQFKNTYALALAGLPGYSEGEVVHVWDDEEVAGAAGTKLQTRYQVESGALALKAVFARPHVDAREEGALGDGTTDATAALLAAATVAAALEVPLHLRSGTYLCGDLTLPQNLTAIGETGAVVKAKSGIAALWRASHGVTIRGVTFDGAALAGTAACIFSNLADRVDIDGVRVTATGGRGIEVANGSYIRVSGCRVEGAAQQGIIGNAALRHVRILGNTVADCGHGIQFFGSNADTDEATRMFAEDVVVVGNTIENANIAGGGGIWGASVRRFVIAGNTVNGSLDVGIDAEGCTDVTITGNTVRGCANACIALFYECTGVVISDNVIEIPGVTSGVDHGIWLTGAATWTGARGYHEDVQVHDNIIRYTGPNTNIISGIQVEIGLGRDVDIHDNKLRNCRIFVRRSQDIGVNANRINLSGLATSVAMSAIFMEGCRDWEADRNRILGHAPTTSSLGVAGIATTYVDATHTGERYSVQGNRIRGFSRSFADNFAGAGRSRGLVKNNGVTGTLERSATGAFWLGQIAENYSIDNPATTVPETTY